MSQVRSVRQSLQFKFFFFLSKSEKRVRLSRLAITIDGAINCFFLPLLYLLSEEEEKRVVVKLATSAANFFHRAAATFLANSSR